jgi:hypothetical protein
MPGDDRELEFKVPHSGGFRGLTSQRISSKFYFYATPYPKTAEINSIAPLHNSARKNHDRKYRQLITIEI